MSDAYQPIYDAVRSRIFNGDIGAATEAAMRNIGDYALQAFQQIPWSFEGYARPSAIYKPRIAMDGNKWICVLGDNIITGVVGTGDSPELAMQDFDKNWNAKIEDRK